MYIYQREIPLIYVTVRFANSQLWRLISKLETLQKKKSRKNWLVKTIATGMEPSEFLRADLHILRQPNRLKVPKGTNDNIRASVGVPSNTV